MTFIDQLKENTKAWEEFERWYVVDTLELVPDKYDTYTLSPSFDGFERYPFEMQSGVFIAFLDSREEYISSTVSNNKSVAYYVSHFAGSKFNNRTEALQSAILKSFELLEKQLQR